MAVGLGHLPGQHGADGAVDVADLELAAHRLAGLDGRTGRGDQLVVQRHLQAVVLAVGVPQAAGLLQGRLVEQPRKIDAARLPVVHRRRDVAPVDPADHLVQRAEAELGHDLPQLFGHEEEVVDDVLGLAGEAGAQHRVLRRHPDGAGVQVTLAHHDAAGGDQRGSGEAELVGAEQGRDSDIAAGL